MMTLALGVVGVGVGLGMGVGVGVGVRVRISILHLVAVVVVIVLGWLLLDDMLFLFRFGFLGTRPDGTFQQRGEYCGTTGRSTACWSAASAIVVAIATVLGRWGQTGKPQCETGGSSSKWVLYI